MKKSWSELSREASHEVLKLRFLFLEEHKNANQIMFNNDGVPLQAIYFTPEMPDKKLKDV